MMELLDMMKQLLNVPDELALEAMLCLGMPKEHPASHTEEEMDLSRIHYEHF